MTEILISLREAIEAIESVPEGNWKSSRYIKELEKLDPVQPERKKGKWLLSDEQRREDIDNDNYLYFCSNCLHSDIHAKTQEVPYCWWCGAYMEGKQDD